ncbi:MAG TPA: hypothetical protein VNN18_06820 [Candidatus Xenobia bacterium]|nr:hypothetical protein [Candidatus Xenobia bacterium]
MSDNQVKREPNRTQARTAARARRLRGAVLALLGEEAPQRLNADVLLGVLERLHYDVTSRELAAALEYLRSKGYVEFEELRSRELPALPRIVRVALTARGADVVDGTVDDPGVDLP